MKKIFLAVLAALTLNACSDSKNEEKKALDDVINIHDKVMSNDGLLMQNKMKLDTLIQSATDTAQKTQMKAVSTRLVSADSTMEVWMQKFDPEQKDKTHGEIMAYMALQKKQVTAVDSQLKVAVKESNEYLSHFKK